MYCPSCGSNNHAEVKFCTRCGTNLGVVSEALTGKIAEKPRADDRMAKLMRDYYRGRRDAITGAVLIPSGLLVMGLMIYAGMNPIGAFFIVCWMFFWGAPVLADGLGKWIAARSELKTLEYGLQSQIHARGEQLLRPISDQQGYSTGNVGLPSSVTEQTTRQLDERAGAKSRKGQQDQSQ